MAKDYYKTLGVEKNASKDEIKKAFRKLAGQYHPDKKTGDEAKFKEVSEAYSVLGNEKKRTEYDTYGQSFAGGGGGAGAGGGQGFGGFDFSQFQQGGGFSFNMDDIFQNFGDMFGGGRERRGRDISIDINLSFKDAIFGVTRDVRLAKNSACKECKGTGAENAGEMKKCETCNGQGQMRKVQNTIMGQMQTVVTCETCHGRGEVPKVKCGHCGGAGVRKQEEEITIKIPAGVQNGEVVRMTGRGEAVQGGAPGDLYIKLHVDSHKSIKREGANLYTTLEVKLTDALLGAEYTVETLDGPIKVKVPAGVGHGELLRIKEKGVPTGRGNNRGDFYVKVEIKNPTKLSRKAKELVEQLRKEGV